MTSQHTLWTCPVTESTCHDSRLVHVMSTWHARYIMTSQYIYNASRVPMRWLARITMKSPHIYHTHNGCVNPLTELAWSHSNFCWVPALKGMQPQQISTEVTMPCPTGHMKIITLTSRHICCALGASVGCTTDVYILIEVMVILPWWQASGWVCQQSWGLSTESPWSQAKYEAWVYLLCPWRHL